MRYFNKIKWAYQRIIRGYDDRIYWAFDEYLFCFIPPLKRFCEEELKRIGDDKESQVRIDIYKETIKRINHWEATNCVDCDANTILWSWIGSKIGWFWS